MRVGWFDRTALKHVYYQVWNRLAVQVGCMRQVLGAGALGWPREMGWRGRWDRGSGWGTHVNPWLIHVNVWQKLLQYCKVIKLQLIKINGKIKIKNSYPKSISSYHISPLSIPTPSLATLCTLSITKIYLVSLNIMDPSWSTRFGKVMFCVPIFLIKKLSFQIYYNTNDCHQLQGFASWSILLD